MAGFVAILAVAVAVASAEDAAAHKKLVKGIKHVRILPRADAVSAFRAAFRNQSRSQLNDTTFDYVIGGPRPVLVKYWKHQCTALLRFGRWFRMPTGRCRTWLDRRELRRVRQDV